MLTLLETQNAINALDTPEDVIRNACLKIIFNNTKIPDNESDRKVWGEYFLNTIPTQFDKDPDAALVMQGLSVALASIAIAVVEKGKEVTMLQVLQKMVMGDFISAVRGKFSRRMSTDPEGALSDLVEMIRGLENAKPK